MPGPTLAQVPTQSYYPRCTLRLILRFDEFAASNNASSPLRKAVPLKTTKNLDGVAVMRSPLVAQLDPTAPPGVTRYILVSPGAAPGGPQDQTASLDGNTWDVTVIPKTVGWHMNGVKEAAELDATIKYIDCPIDPRICRAVAVELYLGCVAEDAFVAQNEHTASPTDAIIPTTFTGPLGETRSNLRFQGWVNDWSVEFGEGEPLITLKCQDNSVMLHNQEQPPRLCLDMKKPLDQAIADYLANFVQFAGLSVEYRPSTDTPPTLNTVLSGTAFRPNLGPPPTKGGGGGGGSSKQSVWDYLTDITGSISHNIRMDGTTVVVQRVRSLMAASAGSSAARPDDPFMGRTVEGTTFQYRRFLYGRNLQSMKLSRNYTKKAVANIEVRSYVTERKLCLVGRFPSNAQRQLYALPGNVSDQKWTVVKVSGITDQNMLNAIAQDYYESMGRQEMAVQLKTKNMGSFGGSNTDPDILDMKVGDTFELLVNRDTDNVNDLTRIETALTAAGQNAALMQALGFSPGFANAYAQAYTNANFLTLYKMKGMKVDWSCDDGITLDIDGINYIEIRANASLPAGQETSATPVQAPTQPGSPAPGST
jgi:hypothetical protein